MISEKALLREKIALLKIQQAKQLAALKHQFDATYESIKPINILKNTLHDVVTSPELKNLLLNNVIGLGSGYVSKKIISGISRHPLVNLVGSLLQMAVSANVAEHPDGIKTAGKNIFKFLFTKKNNREKQETDIIVEE